MKSVTVPIPSSIEGPLTLPKLNEVNSLIRQGYSVTSVDTSEYSEVPHCIVFKLKKHEHHQSIYNG